MRTATTHLLVPVDPGPSVTKIEPPPGGWVLDALRMEAHDDLRVVVLDKNGDACLDVNGSVFADGLISPVRTPRGAFEIEISVDGTRWCGSTPTRVICRWRRASWWRRVLG